MRRGIAIALLGFVSCLLVGCSNNGLPLVPVSGQVSFDGGPCPREGRLVFAKDPRSGVAELPNRPGRADFGMDGKFVVTSFKEGDGLLPGKYRVMIVCMDGEPGLGRPYEKISFVPADYQPEELVIEVGQASIDDLKYDVPRKKKN